ncbi:MAG TPA: thioredoxin family protein [Anaerovoracaceae bacterium]|nr:thioredoxin family protein [Anaerovoracaceae bacterium]
MISVTSDSDFQVDAGLTVVKFWATWCGPCKKMEPTMNQLESEFTMMKFLSVDVDQVPSLAQKFRIRTLPTILVLKDGAEVNRVTGMSLIEPLRKLFREAAKSADVI